MRSAWLQRIVNGGGFIDREYGVGMRRIDGLVRWPVPAEKGGWQRAALELKVRRDDTGDPTPEGLRQIEGYLWSLGLDHGWLVVFDRPKDAPPVGERTGFVEDPHGVEHVEVGGVSRGLRRRRGQRD